MKLNALALATLAATAALSSTASMADNAKHGYYAPHGYVTPYARPVVVSPPAYRHGYAAPVYNGYGYGYGHGYRHHNNGYWRNGRWIAPVLVGAAVLGTAAVIANNYYPPVTYAPPVTYVQPTYNAPVVYAPAGCDTFCQADRDQNGVVDKVEASFDRAWERWFYDIDRNNDGVLTRQEMADWNRTRSYRAY
jgi:hypothetical protein